MPISALVLTLSEEPGEQARAVRALSMDHRLTLGKQQKNHLPLVADTVSAKEGARLVRYELPEVPGVIFVDVVSVNFEDETGES